MSKRIIKHDSSNVKVQNKFTEFLKKNLYYILMVVSILAIGTVITVAAIYNSRQKDETQLPIQGELEEEQEEDEEPVVKEEPKIDVTPEVQKMVLLSPVATVDIIKGFTNSQLVFDSTQKQWATHEGIDFRVNESDNILCSLDGIVKSVETDSLYGTVIVISHSDGYETVYKLMDNVKLKIGDSVKKGDVLGNASTNCLSEISDGIHIHFELKKDSVNVDPMEFLSIGGK